jgi:hypothetical protein
MAPPSQAPAAAAAEVAASPKGALPVASRVAGRASWVQRPSQHFLVEVGGFGFGIHDGKAGAFGGGVEAGYRFLCWLAVGAWLEGSGEREQATLHGSAAYRLYDLGLGLTVGKTIGPLLADLSVLPELTRLTVEGRDLVSGTSLTRWGAAADARLRVGLLLGTWCPFIFVAGSFPLTAESLTFYGTSAYESLTISTGNVSFGLGLAYLFGVSLQGN